jgi:hypothetical protein
MLLKVLLHSFHLPRKPSTPPCGPCSCKPCLPHNHTVFIIIMLPNQATLC